MENALAYFWSATSEEEEKFYKKGTSLDPSWQEVFRFFSGAAFESGNGSDDTRR
jgi:hypothetical protein